MPEFLDLVEGNRIDRVRSLERDIYQLIQLPDEQVDLIHARDRGRLPFRFWAQVLLVRLDDWVLLSFLECRLVHGSLMSLSRIPFLEADLLDVV